MGAGGSSPRLSLMYSLFLKPREGQKTQPVTKRTQGMIRACFLTVCSAYWGVIGSCATIATLKGLGRGSFIDYLGLDGRRCEEPSAANGVARPRLDKKIMPIRELPTCARLPPYWYSVLKNQNYMDVQVLGSSTLVLVKAQ